MADVPKKIAFGRFGGGDRRPVREHRSNGRSI
jgi:hypothetical protein